MLKKIMLISLFLCSLTYSEVSHTGLTGANVHTVYRWQFADSAARVNQSVSAADTMKLAYQRSDSTTWVLLSTTGTKWRKVSVSSNFGRINSDSIANSGGINTGRSIALGTSATGATSTPYKLDLGNTYSDGATADKCKLFFYKNIGATYGIGVGANADLQYHSKNENGKHIFYINDTLKMYVDRNGVHSDSIQLGTGSYLKDYVEGTMACTLKTSDVTVQQIGTAYYTKVGNVLTMSFPELSGTSNSGNLVLYCIIPYAPKQQLTGYGYNKTSVTVTDNSTTLNARAAISWNPAIINRIIFSIIPTASFTSSGTKGVSPFSVSYITE